MYNCLFNLFITIQNGQMSNRGFILQPRKKITESFLKILWNEGFIYGYTFSDKNSKIIKIFLKYYDNKAVINNIKIISSPAHHIFYSASAIWKVNASKMLIIFSTKEGLNSIIECKKKKIGGKPFIMIN